MEQENSTYSENTASVLSAKDIRKAVEAIREYDKQPHIESIHSQHDLADIFKLDTMTRNFGLYGGVPVVKNKLIPENYVRVYMTDGTSKDYKISNEPNYLKA